MRVLVMITQKLDVSDTDEEFSMFYLFCCISGAVSEKLSSKCYLKVYSPKRIQRLRADLNDSL